MQQTEAYSELCQASKIKCFTKIVKRFIAIKTIFAKRSIADVWQGYNHASDKNNSRRCNWHFHLDE